MLECVVFPRQTWVLLDQPHLSVESSLQSISWNSFLWTWTNWSSGIQTWSWSHTWDQRSNMVAGFKYRILTPYSCIRIFYMFPLSKCRWESDLGLYTTSELVKGMLVQSGDFQRISKSNAGLNLKLLPRNRIGFVSPEGVHKPTSYSFLHFAIRNI